MAKIKFQMQAIDNQEVRVIDRILAQALLSCNRTQKRKPMKLSKTLLTIVAAVASVGLLSSAQATPITGMLNIGGFATFNTNSLLTAGSATFTNPHVEGMNTGTFAGFAINFDPSTMTSGLWSVNGFTFNLTSSHVDFRSASVLAVSGVGIITGPAGFDATPGEWEFTSQAAGGHRGMSFSFSANTAAVPDGGMTLALLGAGLVGLAVFRAKFAKV